jgi:hypothetical protein
MAGNDGSGRSTLGRRNVPRDALDNAKALFSSTLWTRRLPGGLGLDEPTGCRSFLTGAVDRALSSESALFFAHGRTKDASFDAARVERLDLTRRCAVVVFMSLKVMQEARSGKSRSVPSG